MRNFIGSIIVATIVSFLATIYVLPRIIPCRETKVDTEVVSDTVSTKVDTLTFEQEIAIVDSAIKAQNGIVYKNIFDVPEMEINGETDGWNQTIVRHPNGVPKIAAYISSNKAFDELWVKGTFLLFIDDTGRLVARGEKVHGKYRWHCINWSKNIIGFTLANPNICMNLK